MNQIILFLTTLLFGERAQGEVIPQPTFRSTYPEERLSENEWNRQFRVSSLHNVHQNVYLN